MMLRSRREGFVLVSVLWVVVTVAVAATLAMVISREVVGAATNRKSLTESEWNAEACAEHGRSIIAAALAASTPGPAGGTSWASLDSVLALAGGVDGARCTARLEPVGIAVDANEAGGDQLHRLFVAQGFADLDARARADALLDWRDEDDEQRPFGAERAWYQAASRVLPRNAPVGDRLELSQVRGLDTPASRAHLTTEPGRICINHAPAPVLLSLPGFGAEVVESILGRRARGERIASVMVLAGSISSTARDSVFAHFMELSTLTTTEPDAWLLIAEGSAGSPRVATTVELKLANAGIRAAVVRRRQP